MMRLADKTIVFILIVCGNVFAQNDLESFLNPLPENTLIQNTFKSTRIINNHSVEIFEPQQLDLRIAHRFGLLNSGLYELYGLDQAKIRIGVEYGLIKNMMIGMGRSSYQKTYDGYIKYADKMSPLGNATAMDCANYTITLFSDLTKRVTLQNLYNDGGFSNIGVSDSIMDLVENK